MDFNSKKILKFLIKNKDKHFSVAELSKIFSKISKDHIIEIVNNLYKNKYVKYVGDASIKITNKGETYLKVQQNEWISQNLVSILALVLSFVAIIVSILSLVLKLK